MEDPESREALNARRRDARTRVERLTTMAKQLSLYHELRDVCRITLLVFSDDSADLKPKHTDALEMVRTVMQGGDTLAAELVEGVDPK